MNNRIANIEKYTQDLSSTPSHFFQILWCGAYSKRNEYLFHKMHTSAARGLHVQLHLNSTLSAVSNALFAAQLLTSRIKARSAATMNSSAGKFLICVPRHSRSYGRLRTVTQAVLRVADALGKDIEVSNKKNVLSVWVYYKEGSEIESPVYSDWGKNWSEDEVLRELESRLYGLSHRTGEPNVACSMS